MKVQKIVGVIVGSSISMSVWAHSNDHYDVHRYQSNIQKHVHYEVPRHHSWHNFDFSFLEHVTRSYRHREKSDKHLDSIAYPANDSIMYRNDHQHWVRSSQFRTRHGHVSDPVISVNVRTSAIQLEGLKRHAVIYEAYAELGNGRIVHLPELQGHVSNGSTLQSRFPRELFVRNIILKVKSSGHKRAYVQVNYEPSVRFVSAHGAE